MQTTIAYKEVVIPVDSIALKGNLRLADNSKGIIIFSHGSGSSRMSTRNNYVAEYLFNRGFSSLLFDLLTEIEDTVYENRFNMGLLTNRLLQATKWVSKNKDTKQMPIAFFGASTGAASALFAAALSTLEIKAIVSRGGRPDLAMSILKKVHVPTLLLVGGNDGVVIGLNQKAKDELSGHCELKIIEGASHLFSEPGKLQKVALLSADWFDNYISK